MKKLKKTRATPLPAPLPLPGPSIVTSARINGKLVRIEIPDVYEDDGLSSIEEGDLG